MYVFNPAGKYLGMIFLNVPTTNCTWGDDGSDALHHHARLCLSPQDLHEGAGVLASAIIWSSTVQRRPLSQLLPQSLTDLDKRLRGGDFGDDATTAGLYPAFADFRVDGNFAEEGSFLPLRLVRRRGRKFPRARRRAR